MNSGDQHHLARANTCVTNHEDENVPHRHNHTYGDGLPLVKTPAKLRIELLSLSHEGDFRKMLKMCSVYDWINERTPKRRDLFKMARVTIGKPNDTTLIQTTPSLTILHGIEHTTWNRTIQALFMTQNCDAMFTLCAAIIYYQRAIQRLLRRKIRNDDNNNNNNSTENNNTTSTMVSTHLEVSTSTSSQGTEHEYVVNGEVIKVNIHDNHVKNHLFMAAATLAMKFYDDLHLSNTYIAKIYRIHVKVLNRWEIVLLTLLKYSLFIHQAERDQIKLDFASRVEP